MRAALLAAAPLAVALVPAALGAAPARPQDPAAVYESSAGSPGERAEIHTFHCLDGCPMGTAATNDLVVREIYTLSSNDATKMADWVAYRVRPETIGKGEGRKWAPDPWLYPDETLEPADYDGAPTALKIDRGHQAPLASFSATPQASETNYLSNITPQRSDLNQASWMYLETAERKLAQKTRDWVYVVTGPLFERAMAPLPGADEPHRVPSGYWKVVAVASGGATKVTAFIFEQETPRAAKFCDMRTTIEEVERRSRLTLFPRFATRSFAKLDAELGCR